MTRLVDAFALPDVLLHALTRCGIATVEELEERAANVKPITGSVPTPTEAFALVLWDASGYSIPYPECLNLHGIIERAKAGTGQPKRTRKAGAK